jgi:hypothetical protein
MAKGVPDQPSVRPLVGESVTRGMPQHVGMDMETQLRSFALSTMRAIMSGDSGPPRSETNTNGDVLSAFSFRNADAASIE